MSVRGLAHYRLLYLDGVHFTIRHGDKTDATIILTALGVDWEGSKEVLALRACAEESKDGWMDLLQDLRTRGATQVERVRDRRARGIADSRFIPLYRHTTPTLCGA